MEECSEIQKPASKAIRFGMDSVHPCYPEEGDNKQKIEDELNDLMAIVHMIIDEGMIDYDWQKNTKIYDKRKKIEHYIKISQELGYVAKCD